MSAVMEQGQEAGRNATIEVTPVTVHTGAEITGVDLKQPISPQTVAEIRAALVQWKVVFFRGQHLDHAQHVAFTRQFGAPTIGHVVFGHDDRFPEIYSVAKHRKAQTFTGAPMIRPWSGWHTDITAAINPPAASILRGDIVPPHAGDTQWTNLAAAYNGLSEVMRGIVDNLKGLHSFAPPQGAAASHEYAESVKSRTLISEHPLVRVHPESGERVLFISPTFLKSIIGMAPRESQMMLEMLWEHAVRPEYTVRFRWNKGDIAFWDNRSTAHLAPRDVFEIDDDRQMYRTTLVGDVPVGVDGRSSVSVEGVPIEGI
ncbi:MAG: TauD/TfdA family dioxygenase [Alphaproteobacteria bacterium]